MLQDLELLGNLTKGRTVTSSVLSDNADLLGSLSHPSFLGLAKNIRLYMLRKGSSFRDDHLHGMKTLRSTSFFKRKKSTAEINSVKPLEAAYHTFVKREISQETHRFENENELMLEQITQSKSGPKPTMRSISVTNIDNEPTVLPLRTALADMFHNSADVSGKLRRLFRSRDLEEFFRNLFWLVYIVTFQTTQDKAIVSVLCDRMQRQYLLHLVTADLGIVADKLTLFISEYIIFILEHTFGTLAMPTVNSNLYQIYNTVQSELLGSFISPSTVSSFRTRFFPDRAAIENFPTQPACTRSTQSTGSAVTGILGRSVVNSRKGFSVMRQIQSDVCVTPSAVVYCPPVIPVKKGKDHISSLLNDHAKLLAVRPRHLVASQNYHVLSCVHLFFLYF